MARLGAIDGKSVEQLAGQGPRSRDRRWALTREQRLTYMRELPADNVVVAGALWRRPGVPEGSVEQDFAEERGLPLGSRPRVPLPGVPPAPPLATLRTRTWRP